MIQKFNKLKAPRHQGLGRNPTNYVKIKLNNIF
jgi:hypothetical protein